MATDKQCRLETLTEVYHRTPTNQMIWKTMNTERLRQELADMNRWLEQQLSINQPKSKEQSNANQ